MKLFPKRPKRPTLVVPVTYNIGWWSQQEALAVNSLSIEVVQSNLNLLNSKSLIAYTVKGSVAYKGNWQPYIAAVHISERLNKDTSLDCDRIIEITPIVKTKQNKSVDGGSDPFTFRNEHIITSNNWGPNRILFVCGEYKQTIELHQSK